MNQELLDFINKNTVHQWHPPQPAPSDLWTSTWPWAPMAPTHPFPAKLIAQELGQFDYLFVEHRTADRIHSYGHQGWWSLTLHGTQPDHTEHWDRYGFKSQEEANYRWTNACNRLQITSEWVKQLPFDNLGRVRIMRLDPGGYIMPHKDGPGRIWGPYNFALTNPPGCQFVVQGNGVIPFRPGLGYFIDIGKVHALYNNSDQPRYHLIVHGRPTFNMTREVQRTLDTVYEYDQYPL